MNTTTKTATSNKKTEKVDVYEIVKQNIIEGIEAIEAGRADGDWKKPWSLQKVRPMNYLYQRPYSGVNLWLLNNRGSEFLTFKQIQELQQTKKYENIKLRKGAKGHMVMYFKWLEKEVVDDSTGELVKANIPMLRYYKVFSLDDIDGLELRRSAETFEHNPEEAEANMDEALMAYVYREGIKTRFTKCAAAYYTPQDDEISLPEGRFFEHYNEHLSTLAHEIVHSTASRMGRKLSGDKTSSEYAFEELVAEFGASLLLSTFGVADEVSTQNNVAYLHVWLRRLKQTSSRKLVHAMIQAQKAVDFILNNKEETHTEEN